MVINGKSYKRYKLLSISKAVETRERLSSLRLFDQLQCNSVTRLCWMISEKNLRNHFSIFIFFAFSETLRCKKRIIYMYIIYVCVSYIYIYIYVHTYLCAHIHNRFSISIIDIAILTGALIRRYSLPQVLSEFTLDIFRA